MKLEHAWVSETAVPGETPESFKAWSVAVALVLGAVLWLLAWYGDTAHSIVSIWQRSDTFAHGYIIVPISAWLIWRRRDAVAALEPRPNFLVLPLLALVGFGWLLGQLAGAGVVQQYALALMIPLLVWSILGNQVVRALAFPLFFLLLAVPFGDALVPLLIEHTANFTVAALRLTGIPVLREGQYITVPTGSWSVVEACAGLRYLIASITLGFIYAYLTYRSLLRRAIFVVSSAIVPIVANWLRAYMIVMIGHLTEMRYAVGVDHLIYGWLFFGVVMLILFWIGSFWREDVHPDAGVLRSVPLAQRGKSSLSAIMSATIAAAVTVVVWPVVAARLDGTPVVQPVLQAPTPVGGWQLFAGPLTNWAPRFLNPAQRMDQGYRDGARRVGLYIGYYRNQRRGSELITSQNTLVSTNDLIWRNIGETRRNVIVNNQEFSFIEARLRSHSARLLAWHWYWVDGVYTANPYWAKILQAKSRLLSGSDDGAVVIVYTELDADDNGAAHRLQEFLNAMLPGITRSLEHAR